MYSILVNKNNELDKNYIPNDLVHIDKYSKKGMARKQACIDFIRMCDDAAKLNLNIINESAYRSYERQKILYEKEVKIKGNKANMSIAKPGQSEHQTGLAFDLCTLEYDMYNFSKSDEYKWLLKNSYKYGFILRYPKGKENITGYIYEPWHFRYLGDLASKVFKSGLTYDEYYIKNLNIS